MVELKGEKKYLLLNVLYLSIWYEATTQAAFLTPKRAGLILCHTFMGMEQWWHSTLPQFCTPQQGNLLAQGNSQIQLSCVSLKSPG